MKKISITVLVCCFASIVFSQANQKRCGTFDVIKYKEQQTPGYLQRVNNTFEYAKQFAATNRNNRSANDTIYRIQCVFHVLYQNALQNIPDSVIQSQIEVLNEDYRRQNADAINTRNEFLPVAADAGIEFYLATEDPDGNPTNGITRTVGTPAGSTLLGYSPFSDDAKSSATGGKNPWPTDRYLNIWVCNLFGGFGVLGYAYPPDNAPNWAPGAGTDSAHQGVVLLYSVVGRNFSTPIDPTVTKGRSAVHEIGHYLGLRHIWGDGDCTADDGIDDTPNAAAASQQTCNFNSNTCVESVGTEFPDMVENYMDYSDDRCLNVFTKGQVDIMRAVLQISRPGIATAQINSDIKNEDSVFGLVSVYPNPGKSVFKVALQTPNVLPTSVEIFDMLGKKINTTEIAAGVVETTINLTGYNNGLYYLVLSSGKQSIGKKISLLN
jgi:hypothetical protein